MKTPPSWFTRPCPADMSPKIQDVNFFKIFKRPFCKIQTFEKLEKFLEVPQNQIIINLLCAKPRAGKDRGFQS